MTLFRSIDRRYVLVKAISRSEKSLPGNGTFFGVAFSLVALLFINAFFFTKATDKTVYVINTSNATGNDIQTEESNVEAPSSFPVENILPKEITQTVNPSDFSRLAATYTQKDIALEYYRNPATKDKVVWFFNNVTKSAAVTKSILKYADMNDIPVMLAFSLAYVESHYKVDAVNYNANSSIDRGIFQLNNKSFPLLTEQDFFNPDISARHGMSHLKYCLQTARNEVAGLAMYNAGRTKVQKGKTPVRTLNYIANIMEYKQGLEILFQNEVISKMEAH